MDISRRAFLKYVGASATALGLSAADLGLLKDALANPAAPTVLWLQGSSCVGCSVSLLNRVSATAPATVDDLLINSINLAYHPTLMAAAGQTAVAAAEKVYAAGNYVLVVEGGVPTAFNGAAGFAWRNGSTEVTILDAVRKYVARASKVVCAGTCASWGGIPASGPNPAGIKGVQAATGKATINISGCPAHPDWICWAIVQILTNQAVALDSYGRPTALYSRTVHEMCERNGTQEAHTFGVQGQCLKELGCRGPETRSSCPSYRWNNKASWCIDANAPCIGCTSPTFPGTAPFYHR